MKKILYITPFNFYPPTNGGSRYIYNYIQEQKKHTTVLVAGLKSQKDVDNVQLYKIFSNNVTKYINPIEYLKLFQISFNEKPAELIVAMPYQAFIAFLISKFIQAKVYLHEQNIEFLRFKTFRKWWWPFMYVYEFAAYQLMDKILFISDSDKSKIIKYFKINQSKLSVSYYNADKTVFRENNTTRIKIRENLGLESRFVVLFFGPLDYQPNREALDLILKKIMPETIQQNKNITFLIVGRNPPPINVDHVLFTGFVDSIEDYINASDLVIVPLLSGGGVRTKILESLSCNKRVISTVLGAEGIERRDSGKKLIVCNDISDFASEIVKAAEHR